MRRWKLTEMDLASRSHWAEYTRVKDAMLMYTDIGEARWHVVNADVKRHARVDCMNHLLSMIPYQEVHPEVGGVAPAPEGYRLRAAADHRPDLGASHRRENPPGARSG